LVRSPSCRPACGAALLLAGILVAWSAASAQEPRPERAVIIVIDGCRADTLEAADTPNLDALAARGVSYGRAVIGHLMSNTPPGHATLVTGLFPRSHGVVGHKWQDAGTGERVNITGWKAALDGVPLEVYAEAGVLALPDLFRQRYPDGYIASVSCGKFYAAMLMGGLSADEIESFPLEAPPGVGASGDARDWTILDTSAMSAAIEIAETHGPRLLMINLPDTDRMGHDTGGMPTSEIMSAVLANVDEQIGHLLTAYADLGLLEETVFVVTADHGMAASRGPDRGQLVRGVLAEVGASGMADHEHIWLDDPAQAEEAAEAFVEAALPGLTSVYWAEGGQEDTVYRRAPGLPVSQELDEAYLALLSTYAGPRGQRVVLVFAEEKPPAVDEGADWSGTHTRISWSTQHVPLVLAGPGIVSG